MNPALDAASATAPCLHDVVMMPQPHHPSPDPPGAVVLDGAGNVLVASDFSEHARWVLDRVARLPLAIGATIELLHVVPDHDTPEHARARLDAARD